jgi:transcriptional regulator with XRE-family HTH domain
MLKLNETDVKKIKADLAAKQLTQKQIGEKFGVGRSIISDIATGRAHADVTVEDVILSDDDARLLKMQGENVHLREERNGLRRQLKSAAKTQGLFSAVMEEMQDRAKPIKALPKARPAFKIEKNTIREHLVMHLSDGHHDQVVTPSDTGGLETYTFPISMCRAEQYIDTTLKWTQQTLSPQFCFPSCTILAYGDHTSGEIHGHTSRSYFRNAFKNSLAIAQLHSLMYRDLAPYFDQINVVYVPGNHGRRSNKKDYLGAHDNWDYLIAKTAELYCRDIQNLNFVIPNAFSINVDIDGIGFNIFHGDDIRSSLGIPWYGLEKRRHKIIALNSLQTGTPVRYTCCGHFHRRGTTSELNGEQLINGAWPATDAFAFNALMGYTEPTQLIHGVNRDKGITWRLPVDIRSPYEASGPRRYKIDMMEDVG